MPRFLTSFESVAALSALPRTAGNTSASSPVSFRVRREKRLSRLERLLGEPASAEAFVAALDEREQSWRRTGASPAGIDEALDAAEGNRGRRKAPHWAHPLILEAEAKVPRCPGAAWREAGGRLDGITDAGRHGRRVSQMLSDRARARALAVEPARAAGGARLGDGAG